MAQQGPAPPGPPVLEDLPQLVDMSAYTLVMDEMDLDDRVRFLYTRLDLLHHRIRTATTLAESYAAAATRHDIFLKLYRRAWRRRMDGFNALERTGPNAPIPAEEKHQYETLVALAHARRASAATDLQKTQMTLARIRGVEVRLAVEYNAALRLKLETPSPF